MDYIQPDYASHTADEWKMLDRISKRNWHEALNHLVEAHGAAADRLIGISLPTCQLRWLHFDTHAALDIIRERPPDGHTHPALPDPGRPDQNKSFYHAFPPTREGHKLWPLVDHMWGARIPVTSEHAGLPQTGMTPCACSARAYPAMPVCEEDVTCSWSSVALGQLTARLEGRSDPYLRRPEYVERFESEFCDLAGFCESLKGTAAAAARCWLARAGHSRPQPAQILPGHEAGQ